MKTIVVNLLGAAGSGKSTLAAEIFAKLKKKGYKCEYVDEYAKHVVYEGNFNRLNNQLIIFGNQYFSLDIIRDKVNIIITDSPILLSIFYNKIQSDHLKIPDKIFDELVMHCYSTFDNLDYFIKRNHEYKQEGRYQNEAEAKKQEGQLLEMLKGLDIDFKQLISTDNCADEIIADIEKRCEFYKNLYKDGMEIERKFLVKHLPSGLEECRRDNLLQGYIQKNGHEMRIRNVNNKKYFLTEKYGSGLQREEYEKQIDREKYFALLPKAEERLVQKTRYYVPLENGKTAELDIYFGKNSGLKTVEVEFSSLEESDNFPLPSWFGLEITNDTRYKNKNLAMRGIEKEKTPV